MAQGVQPWDGGRRGRLHSKDVVGSKNQIRMQSFRHEHGDIRIQQVDVLSHFGVTKLSKGAKQWLTSPYQIIYYMNTFFSKISCCSQAGIGVIDLPHCDALTQWRLWGPQDPQAERSTGLEWFNVAPSPVPRFCRWIPGQYTSCIFTLMTFAAWMDYVRCQMRYYAISDLRVFLETGFW